MSFGGSDSELDCTVQKLVPSCRILRWHKRPFPCSKFLCYWLV